MRQKYKFLTRPFHSGYSKVPVPKDMFVMMIILLSELSYAWIFNEYPSYQDNRRFVSQETGNLYIAKVEKSDVGNYTCVVTNTVTNHKVLGPPTPLILRNDGKLSKKFYSSCFFCYHRVSMERYVIGIQSLN
jgi:hypothetical protein